MAVSTSTTRRSPEPLAIAVIGGFVLSGPLVLLVLPALYSWLDPKGRLAGSTFAASPPAGEGGAGPEAPAA